jgi:3-phenylpropionate/trans-cinnamate dioxygenase ferredoxin subunit
LRVPGAAGLRPGSTRSVDIGSTRLCLVRAEDGRFFAVSDACSHSEASLSDGYVVGAEIGCPMHGALFDLETGEPTGLPATLPIAVYRVSADGDDILIAGPVERKST